MRLILIVTIFFIIPVLSAQPSDLEKDYIVAWKQFYPSKALDLGMHEAVFGYEDLSPEKIEQWLALNKSILSRIEASIENKDANAKINDIHLRLQIRQEIEKWEQEALHQTSLTPYANLIADGIKSIKEVNFLTARERRSLVKGRLKATGHLALAAQESVQSLTVEDLNRGVDRLQSTLDIVKNLAEGNDAELPFAFDAQFVDHCRETSRYLESLVSHIESSLRPKATSSEGRLGRDAYRRKLAIYTNDGLTPEKLEKMALEEIELVKALMAELSSDYLESRYQDLKKPSTRDELIQLALNDMEKDVTANADEYTAFWNGLSDSIADFLRDKNICSVPTNQTLSIRPAPESAGPAARIGWVSSAPPFAPNPWTTLYLPSVPDTLAEKEQAEFWASFNKPFNRMIAIHELFPGHYMQIKMARESPHKVRLLFPYGPYIEGWATFCEKIVLDAGWDADKPLSRLAHLRKRLENANRAYTSVMVHCNDWDQSKVMEFSTKVSLLAPQFAKSLWGRLLHGPMQMTSYFYGGQEFRDLYASEQQRLGDKFSLQEFMDTILRAGPIPTIEFKGLFQEAQKN